MNNEPFGISLSAWETAQLDYADKRERYRAAYAAAYLASEAKTADGKKYSADAATSDLRLARDKAEVVATAEWQAMLVARGPMDHARQPGQSWDAG